MSRLMSRDPFARSDLHRARDYAMKGRNSGCDHCGTTKFAGNAPYLFRYWVERDDRNGRRDDLRGLFCSQWCFRMYHGN